MTTVAPVSLSPGCFRTGMLSPVSADSSTLPLPSTTRPSTGTEPPALTAIRSPRCKSAVSTVSSVPSGRMTVAVEGRRATIALMASEVLALARASRNFPRLMRVRIIPADSK